MFTISAISVAIPAALTDRTTAVLLATAFGYVLSQDIFSNLKALGSLLTSKCKPISRLFHHLWKGIFSKTFSSYCRINFHPISGFKSYLLHLTVSILEGALLLSSSLVIVYFTFTTSGSGASVATTSVGSVLIGLYIAITVSDTVQGVYFLGLFRNPLFPKCSGSTEKFKRWRKCLGYLSIPRRLAVAYSKSEIENKIAINLLVSLSPYLVSPLLMLAYVGLGLETGNTVIPHIWFGITAARILRKVHTNKSAAKGVESYQFS